MAIYKQHKPVNDIWMFTSETTAILRTGNVDYWVRQTDKRKCEYGDGNRVGRNLLGTVTTYKASNDTPIEAATKAVYQVQQKRAVDDLVAITYRIRLADSGGYYDILPEKVLESKK